MVKNEWIQLSQINSKLSLIAIFFYYCLYPRRIPLHLKNVSLEEFYQSVYKDLGGANWA